MTITIKPKSKKESETIKTFLKEIEVDFVEIENDLLDETEYLNSTKANKDHLEKSLKDAADGCFEKIAIDSLWK